MKKINRYRIRGLLGRGGMSKVYKVQVPVIHKILALKLLAPHPVLEDTIGLPGLKDMFRTEAATLARLNHPNIVGIWDYGRHEGLPYYTMAYHFNNVAHLIGESSRPDDPSRPLSVDQSIHLVRQTLEGLKCLHAAGIIHRDIKPFNLLLDLQNTIKICDFGLSKLRGESVKLPQQLKVGSPWYAAPEQEKDPDNIDERADLYAVGICLQRMLTGNLSTAPDKLPSKVVPGLDHYWDRFIIRATHPAREKRYASATQMIDDLNQMETAWHHHIREMCEMAQPVVDRLEQPVPDQKKLRITPGKMAPREAAEQLPVDELWRPTTHRHHRFDPELGSGILVDKETGRGWQQAGSPYPLDWESAQHYVNELNFKKFGGFTEWRLPTMDELVSLLLPSPHGEALCVEPVFDQLQDTLWSCDRRSFMAAWYANLKFGFIGWKDFSARHFVRAVVSCQSLVES